MTDPNQSALQLHEELAKSGFLGIGGCDDDAVISKLREATGNMGQVVRRYSANYPDEAGLEDAIYDKLSEKNLKTALTLYYEVPYPRPTNPAGVDDPEWADRLHTAFNAGLLGGTDEDEVMKVLREANTVNQMGDLTQLYNRKYPGELDLESELFDELSGEELKSALKLYYTGFGRAGQPQYASSETAGTTTSDSGTGSYHKVDGTVTPAIPDQNPFKEELAIVETMPLGKELIRMTLTSKAYVLMETSGDTQTGSGVIWIHKQKTPAETAVRIIYELENAALRKDGEYEKIRNEVTQHSITPEEYALKKLELEAHASVVGAKAAIHAGVQYPFRAVEQIVREYLVVKNGQPEKDNEGFYKYQKGQVLKNGIMISQVEEMLERVAKAMGDLGQTESGVPARQFYTQQGQEFWNDGN